MIFAIFVWLSAVLGHPAVRNATGETLVQLTVDPMPEPKAALRYALLPELNEQTPGNPNPNYLKAILDTDSTIESEVFTPGALRQADRAARMDKPDWQILLRLKTDGISLLLPDLQKMRALAQALQARFRDELALRKFDDALVTARTMFALARHTGEHPTLIGNLVGIAIAFVTIQPLEEMIQQRGCPNLYWALTSLPHPFVSLESGMQGERALILAELRGLDEKQPMSAEQIKKLVEHIEYIRNFDRDELKQTTRAWLTEKGKDAKYVAAAKLRLVEYGVPADRLDRFPTDQTLLLDEKREYEVRRDAAMKYLNLPSAEALALLNKISKSKEPTLLSFLTPSVQRVRGAQGRLEQRIALLRHVEALRMYAAAHEGKLPAALADVEVPLPNDPFTGKPFRYELKDGTAHLRGTAPPGFESIAGYKLHYEITIRK